MIDKESFETVMREWSEWCCSGGLGLRGYPTSAAFIHDYVDSDSGSRPPVDDYPMLAAIDRVVASTVQIDPVIPDVLIAHWEARRKWYLVKQPVKARRLGISNSTYYKMLDQGNYAVLGAVSERYRA